MLTLALLLIGFSIFCALILAITKLLRAEVSSTMGANLAGFVLLLSLAALQWCHLDLVLGVGAWVYSQAYIALLYCVAPSFYFYSRQILLVDGHYQRTDFLHLLPLGLGGLLPYSFGFALAFIIGSGYLLWLSTVVYGLRQQRQRFRLELVVLVSFFMIAIAVLVLAFAKPLVSNISFFSAYAILIGFAFFAAALTLLRFPAISEQVAEAVQANYLQSSLKHIDRPVLIKQLTKLMLEDKLYTQESLNLSILAEQLQLNSHQLSELINSELGKGFALFIREYRVNAAKQLLLEESDSSVLAIALSVGFSSQSNFYVAFREQVGVAPGEFRKRQRNIYAEKTIGARPE